LNHWSECINIWRVTSFGHRLIKEYIWQKPGERYRPTGPLVPLNNFFSITTMPISTKIGRKHACGMGNRMYSNKGAGPFWGPIRGKIIKKMKNL